MAICALDGCDNKAAKRATHCSLACAEAQIKVLRKRVRESKTRFSAEEIKAAGYGGEASPAALRGLRNPFAGRSSAHVAFHVLRDASFHDGVNREQFIGRLEEACRKKNIPLHSPRERVRRVMTDIRARGFELTKDDAGRFRLTGRRIK